MKLALECRTDMLEMVQPLADFDFILAQKVLKDEKYAKFYRGSTKWKVLDNGVNEEGQPMELKELFEVAKGVGANHVISPDYRGDMSKTVDAYIEATKIFPAESVIGVIQEASPDAVVTAISVYKGIIAVPYMIGSTAQDHPLLMALRRALIVSNIAPERRIHLLGYTDISELGWYIRHPNVLTIDTGVPIMLGLQEKDLLDPLESKETPTAKLSSKYELTQKGWTATCLNIALLRRYLP